MSGEIKKEMNRRSFFKWSGMSVLGMMILNKVTPSVSLAKGKPKDYWNEDGYFRQDNVDISTIDQGIIRAKVLNWPGYGWKNYKVVNVERSFIDWYIRDMMYWAGILDREPLPIFAGPLFPSVASYGLKPDPDAWNSSQFSLNNAVKASGLFAPKRKVIDSIIQGLYDHWYDSDKDRMLYLLGLLSNMEDLFDLNKMVGTEIYAYPGHNTHSFLNWMQSPLANMCFHGLEFHVYPPPDPQPPRLPTYELRTIVHMIPPLDPVFDDDNYEFKLTKFANTVHKFFVRPPGVPEPPPEAREDMSIGVIHYICEEFDNNQITGQGMRVAWSRMLDWTRSHYAKVFDKTKQVLAKGSGKGVIS